MVFLIGIDEAGRGPVLGPLVVAGIGLPEEREEWLERLGVRDSKLLSPSRREALRGELEREVYALRVFSPREIDAAVEGSLSLNGLEALGVVDVLGRVLEGLGRPPVGEVRVFIDAPSSADAFKRQLLMLAADWLKEYVKHARVEPGADKAYRIVGAASILAKTERDKLLADEAVKRGVELGSGYPSDPRTRQALRESLPSLKGLVRESWQTAKRVRNEQKGLKEWGKKGKGRRESDECKE